MGVGGASTLERRLSRIFGESLLGKKSPQEQLRQEGEALQVTGKQGAKRCKLQVIFTARSSRGPQEPTNSPECSHRALF